MVEYTPNLNLYKPNRLDDVEVDVSLKENFEKIDQHANEVTAQLAQTTSKLSKTLWLFANGIDDSDQIQNAINSANADMHLDILMFGDFKISSSLTLKSNVTISSNKLRGARITPLVEIDSIFLITSIVQRLEISLLRLDCVGLANYGIKSNAGVETSHVKIINNYIPNAKLAGIRLANGFCNEIDLNEIILSQGDGLQIIPSSYLNITNITRNKIYANEGIGVYAANARVLNIHNNTIEGNKKTGVYVLGQSWSVSIRDNYMENNASVGYTFSTPSRTVKSNIILNGHATDPNIMSKMYQVQNVNVEGNDATTIVDGSLVYAISAKNVTVAHSNGELVTPKMHVVKKPSENLYSSVTNLVIKQASIFKSYFEIDGTLGIGDTQGMDTWEFDDVANRLNLISDNFLSYSKLYDYNGGTIQKSQEKYNGFDVFEITSVASGYGSQWGVSIDTAMYPELKGKYLVLSVKVKTSGTSSPVLTANGQFSSNFANAIPNWTTRSYQLKVPTSGVITFGFGVLSGGSAGDKVYFSNPVLTLLGTPYNYFYKDAKSPSYVASSLPTSGYWIAGETVKIKTPVAPDYKDRWLRITTGTGNVLNTDWVAK